MNLITPIELEVTQHGDQRFYGAKQVPSITTILDVDPDKQAGLLGWRTYEYKRHFIGLMELDTTPYKMPDELYSELQYKNPEVYQQAVKDADLFMKDYTEYAQIRGNKYHLLAQQYSIKKFKLSHQLFPDLDAPIEINLSTPEGILFDDTKEIIDRIDDIKGIEIPVISNSLRIAGTLDIVARFDGVPSIIDLKGSTKAPKPEKRLLWAIQEGFYAIAGEETYGFSKIFGQPVEQLVTICAREDAIGSHKKDKVYYSSVDEVHTKLLRSILNYRDLQAQALNPAVEALAPW